MDLAPAPATDRPQPAPAPVRVPSIDAVRGLVMVVMVLDHVRDYLTDGRVDPAAVATTAPALFFTRWATHFCAPTFVLLAGVGASLSGARRTRGELARHLAARGLILLILEQTVASVGLFFTYPHVVLGLVLWAIGWSMIALAGLVFLPRPAIGAFGAAMIGLHNLADGYQPASPGLAVAWSVLHVPGLQKLPGGVPMLIGYPLIPWIGVMALGYALGPIFAQPAPRRRAILTAFGLAAIAAFVALRWSNWYGDPRPWSPQPTAIRTAMAFLNCQKYPPSLLYLLMTLGPTSLLLAAWDGGLGRAGGPLRTLGRVPLFFYLLQWPIAHGLAVALEAVQGHPVGWMFRFPPFESPPGYGYSLPAVYLAWAVTVGLLYPPSRWYASRRKAGGTWGPTRGDRRTADPGGIGHAS